MNRALAAGPIVWLGIILTTCLLLVLFQSMLWLVMPVLMAIVLYYIMSPWVNLAMSKGISRSRAVFIVTMLLCVLILAVGSIVEPKIVAASHDWRDKIKQYSEVGMNLVDKAEQTLKHYFSFAHSSESPSPARPASGSVGFVANEPPPVSSSDNLENDVSNLPAKYSGDIARELAHWIPSLLLVPYITYFFLLDGPRFKRFLVQAIPNAFFEKALYLFYRVEDQIRRYFQGLLALTALDAISLGVGLWFFGINAPFLLATIAAVLAWLPYLGSIAGGLLVVLVAAHDAPSNPWLPYEVIALFILVRLLDDFVFMPMTVGRSLRMHPLVAVMMILLGGAVAGISGLLLVMPVLGVVMVTGQILGELVTDERVMARYWHARELRHRRARADLYAD